MKKHRRGVGLRAGGIDELLGAAIKLAFYMTDDELDFLAENATDEELDSFAGAAVGGASFSVRREAILVRNKYKEMYRNRPNAISRQTSGEPMTATKILIPLSSLESLLERFDDEDES